MTRRLHEQKDMFQSLHGVKNYNAQKIKRNGKGFISKLFIIKSGLLPHPFH